MRLLGISDTDPSEGAKWLVSKVHNEEHWKSLEPCGFCKKVWKDAMVFWPYWPRFAMASAALAFFLIILRWRRASSDDKGESDEKPHLSRSKHNFQTDVDKVRRRIFRSLDRPTGLERSGDSNSINFKFEH